MMYLWIPRSIPVFTVALLCLFAVNALETETYRRFRDVRSPWKTEMNASTDSVRNHSINCRGRFKEYFLENTVISLFSIALNLGSCPVIIMMNVLVIVAIKTRRRLQSEYNILLACLAGTDLAVGLVSQPLFIAQEILFLSGASLVDYYDFFRKTVFVFLVPCIESLLILAILSTERYIAMKYSLRYASIVTTPRLIGAVVCSWLVSTSSLIFWLIPATRFRTACLCNCFSSHFNYR